MIASLELSQKGGGGGDNQIICQAVHCIYFYSEM